VLALGPEAGEVVGTFCKATGRDLPAGAEPPPGDQVLYWNVRSGEAARAIGVEGPRQDLKRHQRKYAEGDLGDHSFHFRGPEGAMKLKAQNLMMFLHIAEGIDERTWEHHRKAGDYSAWFRDGVKDQALADEAAAIEADESLDARTSRRKVAEAVLRRYTIPAD
jgi:hypothetical protein